ncbi:ROK family protein [Leucobacter muris]|nr:ROK family protein [Leucobacter muris]
MNGTLRIGMDIGGTKTEAVALDREGRVVAGARIPTEAGADGVVSTAERVIARLAEQTGRRTAEFASVGVGIPGRIDRERGEVHNAYNIGVERLPLARRLAEATGLPVALDNDVTAAAIGAAHLMGLDGVVAYLNLGTGLAAGLVIDGTPIRGAHGVTGEIGHLPVDPLERPCPCGQRGCLETVASGSALKRYWPAGGDHPGRLLLAAIDAGDAEAEHAFEQLVRGAASCVRLLALTLDPHTVIVGGGLRLLGPRLLDGIRTALDSWATQSPFIDMLELSGRVQLLAADSSAAAVGAALASEGRRR